MASHNTGHPPVSFEAVLSSLRREYRSGSAAGSRGEPFATAVFLADGESARGFTAAAEFAFEDFAPEQLPSDAPDAIACELALPGNADPARLHSLRRRFMWANHPDRRPDLPRDLANRRVAIANMLIDRALEAKRRGGR